MNRSDVEQLPLRAYRISNGALSSAPNLPGRLKLLNWGHNDSTKGPVILGNKTATVLHALQPKLGLAEIALDFEHNTVPGTDAHKESAEPRPVAAYGTPRVVPGDGLYLEDIRWTPRGKTEAFNYADLSPAVKQDENGEVLFIHSAALTRNGAVHELSFFNAGKPGANQQRKSGNMDETLSVEELGGALGISGAPTKTAVLQKLATLSALVALSARVEALEKSGAGGVVTFSAKGSDGKAVTLSPEEMAGKVINLEGAVTAMTKATVDAERTTILTALSADGKCPINPLTGNAYSADELGKLDVTTLRILQANTAGTVPMTPRSRQPGATAGSPTIETFSAEVGKLMKESGMNRDEATLAARKKFGV